MFGPLFCLGPNIFISLGWRDTNERIRDKKVKTTVLDNVKLDPAKAKVARVARNRRHYTRRKLRRRCFNLELGEAELELLVRLNWLPEPDAHRPQAVALAIKNMLELSSKI